MLLELSSR